jgi:hypothetical protein
MIARTDIKPFCDKHRDSEMTTISLKGDTVCWYVHGCSIEGCPRCYSISKGYFSCIAGRVHFDEAQQQQCPDDEAYLYLEQYKFQAKESLFRCAQRDCSYSKTIKDVDQERHKISA